jgi:DNA-binding GntR family transcriptional regulator
MGSFAWIVNKIIFRIENNVLLRYAQSRNRAMTATGSMRGKRSAPVPATPAGALSRQSVAKPREAETAMANVIAKRLEEDIVLGRRHPRERLVEQDLCDLFHTHRGDVRLALFELEKKGIVQRIPNRGAMVRDLSPKEVLEIYAVREELELMAARSIPFPVAEGALATVAALYDKHNVAIGHDDMLGVFYANLAFHHTIYGLCGNACLFETIKLLEQKVYGIRFYANASPEALERARRDHLGMLDALRAGRRDDLVELTRQHLRPAPQAYIRAYERRFSHSARA